MGILMAQRSLHKVRQRCANYYGRTFHCTARLGVGFQQPVEVNSIARVSLSKRIFLLRHGQAMHNPRAEAAKDSGCSQKQFLSLMQEDDCFDAPLTDLGMQQAAEARQSLEVQAAVRQIDLVVASPLSRAVQTADLVFPTASPQPGTRRVAVEHWREINGWLHNARRDTRKNLQEKFGPGKE